MGINILSINLGIDSLKIIDLIVATGTTNIKKK